jgi:RimJ/RimL family protein N-acetyltransferase
MNESIIILRALADDPADLAALQAVLEGAPRYAALLTGSTPDPGDARRVLTATPPGKGRGDKFVLGIFDDHDGMVGCIDLIRHHPDASSAHVGLLLIAESHQRRGYGRAAVRAIDSFVRGWDGITKLRLNLLATNDAARNFWSAHGFMPTGETKSYRHETIVTEVLVFEKDLAQA